MPFTILITGFGPFPGAPFNPTGPLVHVLARQWRVAGVRRVAHVFATSYVAVDRELPALIARERPDLLIMFGLAQRTRHLRIETCARNVLSRLHVDVAGRLPEASAIAPGGPAMLALTAPAQRLVAAARGAGVSAAVSRDAGSYLCNYLCWRASEAARQPRGPRLVTFVHVPNVRPCALVKAGEAIVTAALAAVRVRRR
jgi:pyroglutamyl-peptidase